MVCEKVRRIAKVAEEGLEPPHADFDSTGECPNPRGKNAHSEDRAAAGAAVGSEIDPIDADLQVIVERWAELFDAVKAGIVAMVRTC
jgi:hypothetical protein